MWYRVELLLTPRRPRQFPVLCRGRYRMPLLCDGVRATLLIFYPPLRDSARAARPVCASDAKGGVHVVRVVWAPRRLGAQEPLRVSCPRVCIELMYQSSGYRTRFDIKQALTSIYQPPTGKAISYRSRGMMLLVYDEISRSEAVGLRRHRQWGHNNGAIPHGAWRRKLRAKHSCM